ncbi:hypothetical protein D3C80_1803710 [compost metagenome]
MLDGIDAEIINGIAAIRPCALQPARLPRNDLLAYSLLLRFEIREISQLAFNRIRARLYAVRTQHACKARFILLRNTRAVVIRLQAVAGMVQHDVDHNFDPVVMCLLD